MDMYNGKCSVSCCTFPRETLEELPWGREYHGPHVRSSPRFLCRGSAFAVRYMMPDSRSALYYIMLTFIVISLLSIIRLIFEIPYTMVYTSSIQVNN